MAFGGPGTVPHATVESFRKIADLCERIEDKEEIFLHGGLVKARNGKDYLFEGKK